jgi:TPR repeat protein
MQIPGSEKTVPAFRYLVVALAAIVLPGLAMAEVADDYQAGLTSYRAGDIVGSMAPLKRAADAGHAPAQALYGTILDSAEFDDEAVAYLRKAAGQNDADGQYGLAKMYLTGEGVATDDAEASRLLRAAAAQGQERAIITLALAYVAGNARLGAADPAHPEAAQFLLKAAEIGEVSVISALVKAYREGGFGLRPDAAQADTWAARLVKIQGEDTKTAGRRK